MRITLTPCGRSYLRFTITSHPMCVTTFVKEHHTTDVWSLEKGFCILFVGVR